MNCFSRPSTTQDLQHPFSTLIHTPTFLVLDLQHARVEDVLEIAHEMIHDCCHHSIIFGDACKVYEPKTPDLDVLPYQNARRQTLRAHAHIMRISHIKVGEQFYEVLEKLEIKARKAPQQGRLLRCSPRACARSCTLHPRTLADSTAIAAKGTHPLYCLKVNTLHD